MPILIMIKIVRVILMKLFYHSCLLSILALPSFAMDGDTKDIDHSSDPYGEERVHSSEDEERGFSSNHN